MLLAIDIGNTGIKIALYKNKTIRGSWRLPTQKDSTLNQCKRQLRPLFKQVKPLQPKSENNTISPQGIEAIVICSVVPGLTVVIKKACVELFKVRALILGEDIIAPIKNLYRQPKQVGQDRLANATAAFYHYGGPAIVVDFGTALTFDVVSASGGYLGGVIVPGIQLSLEALVQGADLLPAITLAKPRTLLGRETVGSMRSGLVYGYRFLVEGILQQLSKELNRPPVIIATGGEAALMAGYCPSLNTIDQNLTLEGLIISYNKAKISKNKR